MSFSKNVKEELSKQIPTARHCQIAEITAILCLCGKITQGLEQEYEIKIITEEYHCGYSVTKIDSMA